MGPIKLYGTINREYLEPPGGHAVVDYGVADGGGSIGVVVTRLTRARDAWGKFVQFDGIRILKSGRVPWGYETWTDEQVAKTLLMDVMISK